MGKARSGRYGLSFAALALACNAAVAAARVDVDLLSRAQRDGAVEVLIVLPDQSIPLLAPLETQADYKMRRRTLVDALRARADSQQTAVRGWLDARGIAYRPYWIANVLWARLCADDIATLAQRGDIAELKTNPLIAMQLPDPASALESSAMPQAIEWGVNKINAPRVWAAGFNGQGVVIAGQDTGYKWDHPALKPHYRGWNGTSVNHNYNWHDAIHFGDAPNNCGVDVPSPCDDNGHGTHTAGTFAGGDGGSNQIGVAPGATWIGCRNMDAGEGTPARYIECMQWLLAPTDLAGGNADPALAPDVISNSWACPTSEGCTSGNELKTAVDNLVAGGIFFAAAAGNAGPSCGTIGDSPAIYDSAFVVGATNSTDKLAGFSSRGPVASSGLFRPDAAAPGVSVRSAWNDGSYNTISGTSMATPHVAGAAALLMSVNPALKGHPDKVGDILRETAVRQGVTDPNNSGCGGLTMAQWPNYQGGFGRIDAWAAAAKADTVFADGFDEATLD